MSPALSLALRSHLDPRRIVLGDVELLELCPRSDCLCTRHPLIRCEELGDEVDVATVRDLRLLIGACVRATKWRARNTALWRLGRADRARLSARSGAASRKGASAVGAAPAAPRFRNARVDGAAGDCADAGRSPRGPRR